ncbi:MAG: hypothetical protein GTO18_04465 [Anaerolineales bacterium]|nr:hypothetical protein [Anaerolineales bacterium]
MDLSTVIDVLSVIAVVIGLFYAGLELRQFRISRERESALELFKTFQSLEFMRGVRLIPELPDNQSREQIENLAGERIDDLYFTIASLEGLGVLVHREELSLGLVEDFFSGIIVTTWLKLRRFVEDERKALDRQTWGEWTQWLAERIIEREKTNPPVPANIEYQNWKPKS